MNHIHPRGILAAIDLSEWTHAVLSTADDIASRYDARLDVIYAERFLPPPYFTHGHLTRVTEALAEQKQNAERRLAECVADSVTRPGVTARLVEAAPEEAILASASEWGSDLIVMGTHGRSGWNRMMMGSVAERVSRSSHIPVLTLPDPESSGGGFRHILCPVNDSDVAIDALAYATSFAARYGARLTVMTSLEDGGNGRDADVVQELCDHIPNEVKATCALETAVRHGDASEEIIRMAGETDADLVVLGAQHRPFFDSSVLGTTSVRVMRHLHRPVLSVFRRWS